jgi:hypothetical protein
MLLTEPSDVTRGPSCKPVNGMPMNIYVCLLYVKSWQGSKMQPKPSHMKSLDAIRFLSSNSGLQDEDFMMYPF